MRQVPKSKSEVPYFGSDFLMLLARHSEELGDEALSGLRDALRLLDALPDDEVGLRAALAHEVATLLYQRHEDGDVDGFDVAPDYCEIAETLGHFDAYTTHEEIIMRSEGVSYSNYSFLPAIKNRYSEKEVKAPNALMSLWQRCTHDALERIDEIEQWSSEGKHAVFACVLAHLACSVPEKSFESVYAQAKVSSRGRWCLPLLERVATAIDRDEEEETPASSRRRRQQIVAAKLMYEKAMNSEFDESLENHVETSESIAKPGQAGQVADRHVVIKGLIAPSQDRDDKDLLVRYECLREPLPLTAMPDVERLDFVRETLQSEFPWATDAISGILAEMIARKRAGSAVLGMLPTLLVGPPGSGKTRLSQRLSDLLGVPNGVISMAGTTDQKVLKGCTRGWSSARPSRIVEFLMQERSATGLFLLDEIDKAQATHNGWAQEVLLDLVEPRNAARFFDTYLMTECDLSHCMYVMTSNSIERISKPLLSRLQLAYVPMPGPAHADVIARGVLADLGREWGLPDEAEALQLESSEVFALRGLAPREMRRAIIKMLSDDQAAQRYARH